MKMVKPIKWISFGLVLALSCNFTNSKNVEYSEVTIFNSFNDTCLFFLNKNDTSLMGREIVILENTFSDTLNIGFQSIHPRETGIVFISQIGKLKNQSLSSEESYIEQLEESHSPLARTKYLCIYKNSVNSVDPKEKLRLRVKVYK